MRTDKLLVLGDWPLSDLNAKDFQTWIEASAISACWRRWGTRALKKSMRAQRTATGRPCTSLSVN